MLEVLVPVPKIVVPDSRTMELDTESRCKRRAVHPASNNKKIPMDVIMDVKGENGGGTWPLGGRRRLIRHRKTDMKSGDGKGPEELQEPEPAV